MNAEIQHQSWRERWQTGRTGWDQGGAHSALLDLLKASERYGLTLQGAHILEPACGRAHNGAVLAGLGAHVVSFDVAPEAVREAKSLYGHQVRLLIEEHDAFKIRPDWIDRFDAVFDRAALCALGRDLRPLYLESAFHHLKPRGLVLSIPFTEVYGDPEAGPPFPIPLREFIALMEPRFELVFASDWRNLSPELGRVSREMMMIWRKCSVSP